MAFPMVPSLKGIEAFIDGIIKVTFNKKTNALKVDLKEKVTPDIVLDAIEQITGITIKKNSVQYENPWMYVFIQQHLNGVSIHFVKESPLPNSHILTRLEVGVASHDSLVIHYRINDELTVKEFIIW